MVTGEADRGLLEAEDGRQVVLLFKGPDASGVGGIGAVGDGLAGGRTRLRRLC